MAGRKDLLASVMDRAGAWGVVRGGRGTLSILAYHRIYDMGDEARFPFDPELVSATVEDFRWQMQALRRHFTPIALSDVVALMRRGESLPRRAVAVTFDDGHRDNYTHAFPVLREARVPATIFVSTAYLGGRGTFWFDEVAFRLRTMPARTVRLATLELELAVGDMASRVEATDRVLGALKGVPDARRHEALAEIAAASGIAQVDDARSGALDWGQVREMHAHGIEFGSHTVTHPILANATDAAIHEELAQSKRQIEVQLEAPADTLAYPVGGESAYDARVVQAARACGYSLGMTYVPGVNAWPLADAFGVRRLHVERYTSRARFRAMLELPHVFAA
jgi:peptidoglycan/xylan/chitin deacetylase (PgdA/CDA1 family)